MKEIYLKVRSFILETWTVVAAVSGLVAVGLAVFHFFGDRDEFQIIRSEKDEVPGLSLPVCDAGAAAVSERVLPGLAALGCDLEKIRICDFQETATPGAETSHGMASHLMQISVDLPGARIPVLGTGRGAQAEQIAFNALYNNLILVLEENNLCR